MISNSQQQEDYKKAKLLFDKEKYDEALEVLDSENIIKSNDFNSLFLLASIYRKKRSFDEAIKFYNNASKIAPNAPEVYYNLGNIFLENNEYDSAYKNYMKSLSIDPNNIPALNNLSLVLKNLNQYDLAIENYNKILLIDNKNIEAIINLGICYQTQGNTKKAKKTLDLALNLDPDNLTLLNVLGNNRISEGNYIEAIKFFEKGKDLANQKGLSVHNSVDLKNIKKNLSTALLETGQIKNGIKEKKESAGYIKIQVDQKKKSNPSQNSPNNNFIGIWEMHKQDICDDIIAFFNLKRHRQQVGELGEGYNKSKKDSIDISIDPVELEKPDFTIFNQYFNFLQNCFTDYCDQWPFLNKIGDVYISTFNVQKYYQGGHFIWPHAERMSMYGNNRLFAWMTYLNTVEEGGETVFTHYDLKFNPKIGRTLIWPAEWTHAHYGDEVKSGEKYIITGWMEMHR